MYNIELGELLYNIELSELLCLYRILMSYKIKNGLLHVIFNSVTIAYCRLHKMELS